MKQIARILASLLLCLAGPRALLAAEGQDAEPAITLEQAVIQVQHETGGKVLSASTMTSAHRFVHRIKILTPTGHVREMRISTEAVKPGSMPDTPKKPAGSGPGNKEK